MSRHLVCTLLLVLLLNPVVAAAAGPTLTVKAPAAGADLQGNSVVISFETTDFKIVPTTIPVSEAGKHPEVNRPGEGHLHFVLDLSPLVVWEHSSSYTFENVPFGEHQLMVELVNTDHSSLSPPVMRQIHFRTVAVLPAAMPATGNGPAAATSGALMALLALTLIAAGTVLRRQIQ